MTMEKVLFQTNLSHVGLDLEKSQTLSTRYMKECHCCGKEAKYKEDYMYLSKSVRTRYYCKKEKYIFNVRTYYSKYTGTQISEWDPKTQTYC